MDLHYPREAQSGVARIRRPIKAGTNNLNNERTGKKLGRLSDLQLVYFDLHLIALLERRLIQFAMIV